MLARSATGDHSGDYKGSLPLSARSGPMTIRDGGGSIILRRLSTMASCSALRTRLCCPSTTFLTIRVISSLATTGAIFEINGIKLGVVVCEDFWNDKTFWKERLYESDPTDEVIAMGADIIVSVNASPYNKGKIKLRCDMVAHRAKLQKTPIVFVNLVGGNDGIIFDGASLIADEEGDIILQATAFEEFVETVELDVRKPDARGITGNEIESIHQRLGAWAFVTTPERMDFKRRFSDSPAVLIRHLWRHLLPRRWGQKTCSA